MADAGTGFVEPEPLEGGMITDVSNKGGSAGERNKGEPAGETLLEGTYDEAASAASFQQALVEWRAGQKVNGSQQRADEVTSKCLKINYTTFTLS